MGLLVRTLDAMAERRARDTVEPFTPSSFLASRMTPRSDGPVTPASSMRLVAVFACIRVLAEGVSALPLITYRRTASGSKERDQAFYLYRLLHDQPNDEMTAVTFKETLTAHAVGWGNGYAEIVRDGGNRPTALWPLRPDRMQKLRENGRLVYRYHTLDGRQVDLRPDQVFHVPGLSFDGMVGYSVLANQRAVELAQVAEDFGTAFLRNNARPGMIASHPKTLTSGAVERLSAQFDRMRGPENANRTVVMEEGLAITEVGIPPQEAQYLETRKYQTAEIARLFRVPPHMIGDVERSTSWGTGIEAQGRQFVDFALGAWLLRWEQAINATLITTPYQSTHFVEFLRDAMLRADTITRQQSYHLEWMDGRATIDELRARENLPPLPDGKGNVSYVPLNMIPIESAGLAQNEAARALPVPDAMAALASIQAASGHAAPPEMQP